MATSKDEFINLRMASVDYFDLPNEIRESMVIRSVDEVGFDYSHDEVWQQLKQQSDKAYKALKNREFDLRHKQQTK
jgi:hypothetical protein